MQPFSAELSRSLAAAPEGEIVIGEYRYRAEIGPGGGRVGEQGPEGEKQYPIEYALGGKNVFYFLTPMERGRLQVLPVAFDLRRGEWFDTAWSALRHFTEWEDEIFDWRDPAFTFNTSCHGCHVSQLSPNYDLDSDTYRTTWTEPGINCETCHGPGRAHEELFRAVGEGAAPDDWKIVRTRSFRPDQINDLCASCHAKAVPLTQSFPPGERFFDHFDLVTLEHADFHPDGRDLGENYTLASWLASPCVRSGQLDCLHCHTSSGRYRFAAGDPNRACLPCHADRVNESAAHTRHPAGSEADRCTACHMPQTEFARMRRSDHSMRPPTPAATIRFGSPNACNLCHADRDAAWADRLVRQWRTRDYQAPVLERAVLIDAARRDDWTGLEEMLAVLEDDTVDEAFTAGLIRLLRECDDERTRPALIRSLRHSSPLVRASAAEALGSRLDPEALEALLGAIRDPFRLVRVRAAAALAAIPPAGLSPEVRADLSGALDEFLASMRSRPDDWASHYNVGNFHLDRGEPDRAVAAYRIASRLRPDALMPLVNAALAYNLLGRNPEAETSLRRALEIDPDSEAAHFNLGLLLGEMGRFEAAAAELETVLRLNPASAPAAFNLCVLRAETRPQEAIERCRLAVELAPDHPDYSYTLAFYLDRQGRSDEAVRILRDLIDRHPAIADSYMLLGAILERRGQLPEAIAVYRRARDEPSLPETARRVIDARLRQLQGP
jgi:tetratricopeptide (TPR) repeat protein